MSWNVRLALKVLWFFGGMCVAILGYAMVIRTGLGVGPWDVLHLGVSKQLDLPLGRVVQLMGLALILFNWSIGIRPSLGAVLNMVAAGPIVQFTLAVLPAPETLGARWLFVAAGVAIAGLGVALYTAADLGAGPRDGLMIGLTRKLGMPVAVVKNGLDACVVAIGWLLGGPLGFGSLAMVLTLGPSIQVNMRLVARLAVRRPFSGFLRPQLQTSGQA